MRPQRPTRAPVAKTIRSGSPLLLNTMFPNLASRCDPVVPTSNMAVVVRELLLVGLADDASIYPNCPITPPENSKTVGPSGEARVS